MGMPAILAHHSQQSVIPTAWLGVSRHRGLVTTFSGPPNHHPSLYTARFEKALISECHIRRAPSRLTHHSRYLSIAHHSLSCLPISSNVRIDILSRRLTSATTQPHTTPSSSITLPPFSMSTFTNPHVTNLHRSQQSIDHIHLIETSPSHSAFVLLQQFSSALSRN